MPQRNETATTQPVRQRDSDLDRLTTELQRLFEGTALSSLTGEGFTPLADLEETDDAYMVEVELPGVKREDIFVEVAGRRLTVTGERKERERQGILRRRTRTTGRFYFEVMLPGDVDEGGIEAHLDHGVLTLRIPKADSERPRKIQVK